MKRIFTRKLLLSAAACLLSAVAFASDYTDPASGLEFTLNTSDNTATVTAKTNGTYSGVITIPETVTNGDVEYTVTTIDATAFKSCTGMTEIHIPKTIKNIANNAFDKCTGLKGVYIEDLAAWCKISFAYDYAGSNGVRSPSAKTCPLYYAKKLYVNGTLLKNLEIPDGVTSIGDCAFVNCTEITDVTIPSSVKSIGYNAFGAVKIGSTTPTLKLANVHITDLSAWCAIYFTNPGSNPLSNASRKLYLNDKDVTELEIPDGVTSIGQYAFYNFKNLKKITFPKSLKSIGKNAFYGNGTGSSNAPTLSTIQIADLTEWCKVEMASPNNFTKSFTLQDKEGNEITKLTIPKDITEIKSSTFQLCKSLTEVTIPSGVTAIGSSAFNGCTNLKTVYFLGDKIPSISNSTAFTTSATIYYPKGANTDGFAKLTSTISKVDCEYVDVTSARWATGCLTKDATVPDGTTAYYASATNDNSVTLTEIPTTDGETVLPKNEGFVYNAEEGRHLFIPYTGTSTVPTVVNKLIGVNFDESDVTVKAESVYVLNVTTDGSPIFKLFDGSKAITANHAYLSASEQGGAKADALSLDFGDAAALNSISTMPQQTDNYIYNLQGQRVSQMRHGGVYIQNGKKILAK